MQTVPIDQVVIDGRRRSLRGVDELAESIGQLGLLQPIVVTQALRLVAGAHRLEACKRIGWSEIPVTIVDLEDLELEMAELDENLRRNELSALERAEHLERRKRLYEALNPESRHVTERGGPGRGKTTPDSGAVSFVEETAAKTGRGKSTVREEVQIAARIPQDVRDAIRETPVAESKTELLRLAKLEPDEQRKAVERFKAGASPRQAFHSSESNEWYTPEPFIEAARKLMGGIDLDPASCAEANEVVKASRFYTAEDDGLSQAWAGKVWLNPPYGEVDGESNQAIWTRWLLRQFTEGPCAEAVLLVNAVTDRKWFQPLWDYPICFVTPRIAFRGPGGKTGRQPTHGNAVVYLGPKAERFVALFHGFGRCVVPKEKYSESQ